MSAGDSLSRDQFRASLEISHEQRRNAETNAPIHVFSATSGDQRVGNLYLNHEQDLGDPVARIDMVNVHPLYRRRGVATALLEHSRATLGMPVLHSDNLSDDGKAWAAKRP